LLLVSFAKRLSRIACLEFPNHPPDAVSFSPLNDLQGSGAVEGGVRLAPPRGKAFSQDDSSNSDVMRRKSFSSLFITFSRFAGEPGYGHC
jgi:hypothetical protein